MAIFFSRGDCDVELIQSYSYTHCSVPSEKLHDASRGLGALGTRDWQSVAWVNERRHAILLKKCRNQQRKEAAEQQQQEHRHLEPRATARLGKKNVANRNTTKDVNHAAPSGARTKH